MREIAVPLEQNDGFPFHDRGRLGCEQPEHVVDLRRAGELARELVERLRRFRALTCGGRLLAQPAGEAAGHDGDDEEDQKREELVGRGNRQRVARIDEEEIVGKKR